LVKNDFVAVADVVNFPRCFSRNGLGIEIDFDIKIQVLNDRLLWFGKRMGVFYRSGMGRCGNGCFFFLAGRNRNRENQQYYLVHVKWI
jgi:hypothetical protein